jgi:YVTN family beta-propeller protein
MKTPRCFAAASLLLLGAVSLFAQGRKVNPPPDSGFQRFSDWIWDIMKGRERHTTCYDYCAGKMPRSICTTRISKDGNAIEYYTRDLPYPQNPSFNCDYNEGNPDGVIITGVVPSYEDRSAPVANSYPTSRVSTAKTQSTRDASNLTALFPPFLNIPFPPAYLQSTTPQPAGCVPIQGRDALFVNHDNGTVTRVTACGGQMVANIVVGDRPLKIAATPDNKTALVTNYGGGVTFIDLTTNTVTFTLPTPNMNLSGLAISPDGTQAWVTNYLDLNPVVAVIDLAQRKIVNTITVGQFPQSVYFTPDGLQAWVPAPFVNAIYIIDTTTQTVARVLTFTTAYGIAFNSTGTQAYVANNSNNIIQVLDTATFQNVATYPVGAGPVDVSVSNDDEWLFVTNNDGGSLSIIDLPNGVTQTVQTGAYPRGLAQVQ